MSTTTTKRWLLKPDRGEFVNVVTQLSNNMENLDDAVPDSRKINGKTLEADRTLDRTDFPVVDSDLTAFESAATAIENGIAIVSIGDTHDAISSGQYVYVKGHDTLDEGLYVATANIAMNGALVGYVSAVDDGALNALRSRIVKEYSVTATRSVSAGGILQIAANEFKDGSNNVLSTPTGYYPASIRYIYPGAGAFSLAAWDIDATGANGIIWLKAQAAVSASVTTHLTIEYRRL